MIYASKLFNFFKKTVSCAYSPTQSRVDVFPACQPLPIF